MKIKNLTPFPAGPKLTSRRPPQREMTVVVRGAFALVPGEPLVPFARLGKQRPLQAEEFLPDDDERRGEAVYGGDFADYKLRGEVLLRGTCYPPGGQALRECPVRFSVGSWSKSLRVVGRRVFSDGLLQTATEPVPFTSMPLTYANAFGGPGWAKNPVGKGFGALELPNVEASGEPVRTRGDRPEPAGFGPIASTWPQRAGKVGTEYGASWRKTRAPFYAEDFDWSYFNAAPPDQWLDGYLRGDEEVSFVNLHPTAPSFSTRLPGLRVRAFVKDDEGRIREAQMSLDTLFADPDQGRLSLTWRGLFAVREDDFADVAFLLVASEPLASEPLPDAHYRAIIEAYEADPRGVEKVIGARLPAHLQEPARRLLKGEKMLPAPAAGTPPAEAMTQVAVGVGGFSDGDAARVREGIEKAIASANAIPDPATKVAEAMTQGGLARSAPPTAGKGSPFDLGAMLQKAMAAKPGGGGATATPNAPVGGALRQLGDKLAQLRARAAENDWKLPAMAPLDALLADPRIRAMDPSFAPPGADPPPPLPEPGPGVDCAGRDFGKQDLSGRDLRGASFKGAVLSGAKLVGTQLGGANLQGASLVGADLTDANLDGADLTQANCTRAVARGASFRGATLDHALFQKADLTAARLEKAHGKAAVFTGANLTDARAAGVDLVKALAKGATLDGADFTEARLTECYFLKCSARRLVMRDAAVGRTSFAGSDLDSADFINAHGERTIWTGAKLDRADFSLAVLPWAFFSQVTGTATRFYGANLKEARFYRASLAQAEMMKANLFGANFTKATLTGTRFTSANLYDAKFLGSAGSGTDFNGANLKRAVFEPT
jgi:uncharacterized protein YjbI with pentapeptide repeats